MLALAHYVERLVEEGAVASYADAARQLRVTRARMRQILNLLKLPPRLQEGLLLGDVHPSERRMRAPAAASTELMLMFNPVRYHPGGNGWNRDFHPQGQGPLDGLEMDLAENGPVYVQWNIPL